MKNVFTTKHNIKVVTEIPEIDLTLITYIIDFYINSFSNIRFVLNSGDLVFSPLDIISSLSGTEIIWKRKLKRVSLFKKNIDKNSTIKKNKIYLNWVGNVTTSDLFHALHHSLHVSYLKKDIDIHHKDKMWWNLADKFKIDLEEEIMLQYAKMFVPSPIT